MKETISKKYFFQKLFLSLFLAISLVYSPFYCGNAQAASSSSWVAAAAMTFASIMNYQDSIKGFMLGIAKQAAMKALSQEINFMITGKSSQGTMFVSDYRDYLIAKPKGQAVLYTNARIDQALGGRGSLSGYIPAGSEGFGLAGGNYMNSLRVGAQSAVTNPADPKVTYVGNPSQMFAQGNFRNLSLYLSGINNPWAFNLFAQNTLDQKTQEEQKTASDKLIANQGFPGTESNGKTITPGILVKEASAGVQNMGYDIISNATHIPEIATALVSQLVTQSINQGIGMMQATVHREIGSVRTQVTGQMNAAVGSYGPGALYTPSWMIPANSNQPNQSAQQAQCNSCLDGCTLFLPAGSQKLTDCQTGCAPKCGG